MKNPLLLLFLLVCLSKLSFAQSDEVYLFSYFMGNGEDGLHLAYSEDGLQWKPLNDNKSILTPTAGEDKLMRDPCIIRGRDDKFHMVWTVSWNEKGLGYASSKDLVHWSKQEFIPVMEHEENARNTWAPEVFYDAQKERYLIFWSSTVSGLYPETQDTLENAYNHRMYYTTTKDFKKFSKTRLFYEPGFNVIDGTIIKHEEEFVMFVKDETRTPPAKNIRMTKTKHLTKGFPVAGSPITGDYWAEGPTPLMVDGRCLLFFDKYRDHQMGAVASSDFENWEDISGQINFPAGTRHGTAFTVSRKEFEKLLESIGKQPQ